MNVLNPRGMHNNKPGSKKSVKDNCKLCGLNCTLFLSAGLMERTNEFLDFATQIVSSPVRTTPARKPSVLVEKAVATYRQIESFERLLHECRDGFVNYHRYLPDKGRELNGALSDRNRSDISQEVVQFISAVTGQIQEINNMRDNLMSEAEEDYTALFDHYKLIKESLLSKLSAFTAKSDKMQKEYRANSANPFRIMSDRYLGCIYDVKPGEDEETKTSSVIKNFFFGSEQTKEGSEQDPFLPDLKAPASDTAATTKAESKGLCANETFAQRYIDEIAPQSKMREYEAVAVKQKEVLVREARQLKVRYSEDIQESQRMERTMNNITSMISEFVQLIESQTVYVDAIGEVSQDTTASVKSADAELLLTLERTQSHQWSMISFIVGMALLLLLIDFLSP